ncbi:MAG: MBL fold metallo-hydrolase [Alphaproteobacteria bacterium]|nr:MAG: MBL fold metallo-hydrolase [Alphaproteobacteria bacterium]
MSAAQPKSDFSVRFWGVRGSTPCAGPEVQKYGGNTSCLEITCGTKRLIFDAGTGLRYLGNEMVKEGAQNTDIFLTHTHLDHVCGMPFFKPFYSADNTFRIYSGHSTFGCCTKDALENMMVAPLLPMDVNVFSAEIDFVDFPCGGNLTLADDIVIRTAQLNHPNGATGYRIEYGGRSICYITDTEHKAGELDQNILNLIQGTDIFIYDSTYTDEELTRIPSYGHSTWEEGVRLAEAAGVGCFVAFHHDPDHDDEFMDQVATDLEKTRPGSLVAREGMVLTP